MGSDTDLPGESQSSIRVRHVRAATVALGIFAADQLAKWAVVAELKPGASHWLVPGVLSLRHQRNRWAAYGTLSALPDGGRALLLYLLPLVLCAAVLRTVRGLDDRRNSALVLGVMLSLGGASSNLFDRLARGFVIDYLGFFTIRATSPTYNLADAAIMLGVFLMVLCAKWSP